MEKLGKFELREQIGRGAMAEVYKAWDPSMRRWVAVKKIKPEFAENPQQLERFIDEAVTAGNLEHPNIVTIFESGQAGDRPFIAMAYLEGGSLDKVIQSKAALPLSQKVGYIVHVCRALEYAHRQGVFHRDIKPSNVMLTADGVVKVVDFGIARLEDSARTETGTLMGTLGYMSPELIAGKSADAKSDIWALGIMFYELLALNRPFNGDNPAALMMNIQSQLLPSILEAAPGTPVDLAAVIEAMLQKDPSRRYQSMDEVLIDLEPIWRRLQEAEVAKLVAVSKQLLTVRDLAGAQNAAVKALQIDTANFEAKAILDKIKTEFRRREILPKVEAHVEKGQKLLSLGQLEKARAEVEAAIALDSGFLPAHELYGQVEIAAEKARVLERDLRIGKQRLAEGAITEAEIQLTKVLESDPTNAAAQELLKQIRAEMARRDRQKRLSDLLRRARALWTDFQYDECIQILLDSKSEFPSEGEIEKLLETARQDKAEQERQTLLNEARKFLRSEKFDEALKSLEEILARFPEDNTAKNLYRLVLQGQEQQIRDRKFTGDLSELRTLIKDANYKEAIERGEQLLKTYPEEFQLADLIAFARTENVHQELRRRQERQLEQINQNIQNGRFREAIQAAETALKEFPQNTELTVLLESAKTQQAEKEKRELRDRRVTEIRALIGRGDLTGARDLARQTLEAVGPDTEIQRLQLQAEAEYEQLEKKRRRQQEVVEEVRGLLDRGKLGDAGKVLQQAVAESLLSETDPRVAVLRREIEEKRRQEERAAQERQRRLADTLQRAQALWKGLRYRECIEILQEAQKEYPGEAEIGKLLEMARHDEGEREKAEKQKQEQMVEARKRIGVREYEGALGILDQLLKQWPTDAAVKALREVVEQGRQEQLREQQLKEDLANLRRIVGEGRYQDAIAKGEKLRLANPRDVEIPKLVAEAKSGQARIERQQLLDQWNAKVGIEIKSGRFREAMKAAETGLQEFPKDRGLATLLERAKTHQVEKENRDLLDKRIEEIRTKISRDDLKGAIKLAIRTLESVGHDDKVAELLQSAKLEIEQREQKGRDREESLQSARELIRAGSLDDASKILDRSVQTGLFFRSDPRLVDIRRDIEKRQARLKAEQQKQANSKRTNQPEIPSEQKGHDEQTRTFSLDNATIIIRPSAQNPAASDRSLPSREVQPPAISDAIPRTAMEKSSLALWKKPITIGALAVVAIAAIGIATYHLRPTPVTMENPSTTSKGAENPDIEEQNLWNQANQLMADSPRRFADSLAAYEKIAELRKLHEKDARTKIQEIQALQRQEKGWMDKGNAARDSRNYDEALNDFENAEGLNGDREKDAEASIATVKSMMNGSSLAEVAQKNLKQADDYMAQKKWGGAESLYRLVKDMKEAPVSLRNSASDKETLASAHVTEEMLMAEANSAKASKPEDAKVLYQKVVGMKLDHQQEAEKAIQEIDAEIAKGNHLRDLPNQIRVSIGRGDPQGLQDAKDKYKEFLNAGGQDTAGLVVGINDLEKKMLEADKVQKEKAELARYQAAEGDFKSALARKDVGALNGNIKEEFQKLVNGEGSQATAANDYVMKKIPDAIKVITEPPKPAVDDRGMIARVLDQYKDGYNHRNIKDLKDLLPENYKKEDLDKLDKTLFKNPSISVVYKLDYDQSRFIFSPDGSSATAVAMFQSIATVSGNKQPPLREDITFRLEKKNSTWHIVAFQ
jgi:serine/threonine protein kinase